MDASMYSYLSASELDLGRARDVRARDRLVARWKSPKLDRALAKGVPPETSGALLLRARTLVGPRARGELSRALQRILREASSRAPRPGARMPVRRNEVMDARDDVNLLARRLLAPAPVDVRGVAQVRLLLSDGSGPLFWRRSADDLRGRIREAIEALELNASHEPAPAGGREPVR
jgi:hypothetical protein